jgi:hypothetical protein
MMSAAAPNNNELPAPCSLAAAQAAEGAVVVSFGDVQTGPQGRRVASLRQQLSLNPEAARNLRHMLARLLADHAQGASR